jgi:transcriptional regulator with XRE-family HTH domain
VNLRSVNPVAWETRNTPGGTEAHAMAPERIQVAALLRRMREEAGVTRDEAAAILGCTRSKIGDLETGRSRPKPAELERLLDQYGINGRERDEMIEFAHSSNSRRKAGFYSSAVIPPSVRRAVDLESQAISTIFYSGDLIPGMLQVPGYARALLEWGWTMDQDDVTTQLSLRAELATVLTRTDRPPLRYWCILGEAALRAGIGGSAVMREQINHLIGCNRTLGNVVIQILPLGTGPHSFLGLTVTLLRFPPPAPDKMLLEGYEREIVQDEPAEILRATHRLDLLRAEALSMQNSTVFMEQKRDELRPPNR